MRRSFVLLLVYLSILRTTPGRAQYYYYNDKYYNTEWVFELGGSLGLMNGLTDIGGRKGIGKKFIKDLNWKMAKPSFSLYAIAMYKDAIGVRLEGTFGTVRSYDSVLKSVAPSTLGRYERNLSFKSSITEVQLVAEVHPFFFKQYEEGKAPLLSPYLVAGLGLFNFNPQAYLNGQWHYLHSLRTEGEGFAEYKYRKPYKLTQFNVPLGIGAKYEVNAFISVRLEFVYRILFDYIDPALFSIYLSPARAALAQQLFDRRISTIKNNQRGDPKDNDAFFTIQLKIGVTLRSKRGKQ